MTGSALDVGEEATVQAVMKANENYVQVKLLMRRTKFIRGITFNFNILSEKACLTDYRFKRSDIARIMNMVQWCESTERNRYRCDIMTATCIFLHRLDSTVLWYDIECTYGMFS